MKKHTIVTCITSIIVLVGVICVNCNSASWFHQPKAPSMLVK